MKVKFLPVYLSFFLTAGMTLTSLSVFAQSQPEGLSPKEFLDPNHQELNLDDDKTLLFDQDAKVRNGLKDSLATHHRQPITDQAIKPFTGKNEDDVLSFNFLYYIIQKFKISDLVDE